MIGTTAAFETRNTSFKADSSASSTGAMTDASSAAGEEFRPQRQSSMSPRRASLGADIHRPSPVSSNRSDDHKLGTGDFTYRRSSLQNLGPPQNGRPRFLDKQTFLERQASDKFHIMQLLDPSTFLENNDKSSPWHETKTVADSVGPTTNEVTATLREDDHLSSPTCTDGDDQADDDVGKSMIREVSQALAELRVKDDSTASQKMSDSSKTKKKKKRKNKDKSSKKNSKKDKKVREKNISAPLEDGFNGPLNVTSETISDKTLLQVDIDSDHRPNLNQFWTEGDLIEEEDTGFGSDRDDQAWMLSNPISRVEKKSLCQVRTRQVSEFNFFQDGSKLSPWTTDEDFLQRQNSSAQDEHSAWDTSVGDLFPKPEQNSERFDEYDIQVTPSSEFGPPGEAWMETLFNETIQQETGTPVLRRKSSKNMYTTRPPRILSVVSSASSSSFPMTVGSLGGSPGGEKQSFTGSPGGSPGSEKQMQVTIPGSLVPKRSSTPPSSPAFSRTGASKLSHKLDSRAASVGTNSTVGQTTVRQSIVGPTFDVTATAAEPSFRRSSNGFFDRLKNRKRVEI